MITVCQGIQERKDVCSKSTLDRVKISCITGSLIWQLSRNGFVLAWYQVAGPSCALVGCSQAEVIRAEMQSQQFSVAKSVLLTNIFLITHYDFFNDTEKVLNAQELGQCQNNWNHYPSFQSNIRIILGTYLLRGFAITDGFQPTSQFASISSCLVCLHFNFLFLKFSDLSRYYLFSGASDVAPSLSVGTSSYISFKILSPAVLQFNLLNNI